MPRDPSLESSLSTFTSQGRETILHPLESRLPGIQLEILSQAVSTNSLLLDRLRRSSDVESIPPAPCLLVAEQQTGGRGRLGRVWHSTPGASLTFSLALPLSPPRWEGLSLAIGVALAEAIEPTGNASPRIGLKWPNDLWLLEGLDEPPILCQDQKQLLFSRGRKLGGILVETVSCRGQRWAIVGVGLNVRSLPADDSMKFPTASWAEVDESISVQTALGRVSMPLLSAIQQFESLGFASFLDRYDARDLLRGQDITLSQGSLREGRALGVTPDGALRVEAEGAIRDVISGEVSVRLKSA